MKNEIIEIADQTIAATYARYPVVMEKGKGTTLWDVDGKTYTDFLSGIAVCNLGHSHPEVAAAVAKQANTLFHVSNLYYTMPQTKVAQLLVDNSFADRVFFCNSGAEANEAAIKLARKYFKDNGQPEKYKIISMERSFHGRTMAALSATGQDKIKKGFDPVLEGFDFADFNHLSSLKAKIDDTTCAVIVEPVQGEGGIRCPDPDYLKKVRSLCDEKGILLIFDEIQTGMGRCGKLFAYENFDVEPDIMTLAKALANGLPMGAMLATEKVAKSFNAGAHASTFGGGPIVTAAAQKVLDILVNDDILDHCRKMESYFKTCLEALKEKHDGILDVRGLGLLVGIKLDRPGGDYVKKCMEKGFLINCVQDTILRFAPPLIISEKEIDALMQCLDQVLEEGA